MRNIVLIFPLTLLISCGSTDKSRLIKNIDGFPSESYNIVLGDETDSILTLSLLGSDILYIPLETNQNCYIGEIRSAIITDNRIVVLDRHKESLIIFNIEGAYVFRLDPTGKGPKEFLSIGDYSVNEVDNVLAILDDKSSKVNFYDLSDGGFIESFRIERHWLNIEYFHSSNEICFNSPRPWYKRSNNSNFGLLTNKFELYSEKTIPSQYTEADPNEPLLWNSIAPYQDYLSFWESFLIDTIYLINQNLDYIPYVSFDLGANEIPYKVLKDRALFNSPQGMEYSQLVQFHLSQDHVFFTIMEHRTIKRYVFDKNDKFLFKELGSRNINTKLIRNDIDYGMDFWPIGQTSNNELFQAINPLELLRAQKGMTDQPKGLLSIINQINEGSNPIIQIIKN